VYFDYWGGGCEDTPTASEERLLTKEDLPLSGLSSMPFDHFVSATGNEAPTPTLEFLHSIIAEQDDLDFAGVSSKLENRGTPDELYTYQFFPLRFPKGIVKQAAGKTRYYSYTLFSKNKEMKIRHFEAIVPDHPIAKKLMDQWLSITQRKQTATGELNHLMASSIASETETGIISASSTLCFQWEDEQCHQYWGEDIGWGSCDVEICPEDDGGGGGSDDDSWPDDDSGGNWEEDEPCDDPNGCEPSGGSSENSGNDDNGCNEEITFDCFEEPEFDDSEEPEPCDTEDEYIDTMSEQDVLNQLWLESFGPGTGFDQDDRREMGGWLVEDNNGDLLFEPFPGDLDASICHISGVPPPPDGAVAVIHTHPMIPDDGERIMVSSCIDRALDEQNITDPELREYYHEVGLLYESGPTTNDIIYAKTHSITSYYIDYTQIEKYYNGEKNEVTDDDYDRCGF